MKRLVIAFVASLCLGFPLGISLSSCASSQALHTTVAVDTAVAQGLHLVLTAEREAYAAGVPVVVANHAKYLAVIRKADEQAITITDAIEAWRVAGSSPTTLPLLIIQTKADFTLILTDLKNAGLPDTNVLVTALTAALNFLS